MHTPSRFFYYQRENRAHNGEGIIKTLMAGPSIVMSAPGLVKNGIDRAKSQLQEFSNWMDIHEYESANNFRGGLSQHSISHLAAFERANYMKALMLFENKF